MNIIVRFTIAALFTGLLVFVTGAVQPANACRPAYNDVTVTKVTGNPRSGYRAEQFVYDACRGREVKSTKRWAPIRKALRKCEARPYRIRVAKCRTRVRVVNRHLGILQRSLQYAK